MITIVTGLSGSGKTALLKAANLPNTFYADDYIKDVFYIKGAKGYQMIEEAFGSEVVDGTKVLTSVLGKIVFNDKTKLNKLNNIVSPLVREWIKSIKGDAIIEMAVYINYKEVYEDLVDNVILVTRDTQDLDKKFTYMDAKEQPISKRDIKPDYVLNNDSTINKGSEYLKELYLSIKK